jgi:hypothetical protein
MRIASIVNSLPASRRRERWRIISQLAEQSVESPSRRPKRWRSDDAES